MAKKKKKVKGKLPCRTWLEKNGYTALRHCMKSYPRLFSHIEQENRRGKFVEEWVKIAENMASQNNNVLPSSQWLQKKKNYGLDGCIRKYPEEFAHIEQDKKKKNINEWIKIAEDIERDKEYLPNNNWLKTNGYIGLANMIHIYPNKFKHIKQKRGSSKTSLDTQIKLAKELEKIYGELPYYNWLLTNGYGSLAQCILKHPKEFNHIKKQVKRRKTAIEYIKIVKKLTIENEGILPKAAWLRNNGYSGLYQFIKHHPEHFSNIKQDHRNGVRTLG